MAKLKAIRTTAKQRDELARRLLHRCEPDANCCWIWRGAKTTSHYGTMGFDGRQYMAHRLAYLVEHDMAEFPSGLYVLHKCDVPACINPSHLFLGTATENMADRDRKGRQQRGAAHYRAKLTEGDVRDIRALAMLPVGRRAAMAKYKLAEPTVRAIVQRRTWKHVA